MFALIEAGIMISRYMIFCNHRDNLVLYCGDQTQIIHYDTLSEGTLIALMMVSHINIRHVFSN